MNNAKKLGFGCMRLPLKTTDAGEVIDTDQFCSMIDEFIAKGFTYFDTAYMYHDYKSELAVRESLVKRHPRDSYTLASKLPVFFMKEAGDNERYFQEQLEKCGVDYFDYYLIHSLTHAHYDMAEKFGCFQFLQQMKDAGKIRYMGFSYHDDAELLDRILSEHPETDFVQLQVNYVDWESEGIQSRKCLEVANKHKKPVVVMEPVKGGTIASVPENADKMFRDLQPDLSAASWAVRFAASQKGVFMVLSGMSNIEQLRDNISYMIDFVPLNEAELSVVHRAAGIIHESVEIQCTVCRYCVEGCPKNIAIPEYFSLYNEEKRSNPGGGFSVQQSYFANYAMLRGKPSDCIECGACEDVCPQKLPIIELLKKVSGVFEK